MTVTLPAILDFARAQEFKETVLKAFLERPVVKLNCKKVEVVTTACAQILVAAEKHACAAEDKKLVFEGLEDDGMCKALIELGFEKQLAEWRQ